MKTVHVNVPIKCWYDYCVDLPDDATDEDAKKMAEKQLDAEGVFTGDCEEAEWDPDEFVVWQSYHWQEGT